MFSFSFHLVFTLFIFVQLRTIYSAHDLSKSASHVIDFDLNQPAEQDEEIITTLMVGTVPNNSVVQTAGSDVTQQQSSKKQKTIKDREKTRMNNRRHVENLRLHPKSFAEFKARRNQIAKARFESLSKIDQEEFRAKESIRYKEYIKLKKALNPNFQKIDNRKELRKKIKEGNPTKEELRQFEELKAKDRKRSKEQWEAGKKRNQKRRKSN